MSPGLMALDITSFAHGVSCTNLYVHACICMLSKIEVKGCAPLYIMYLHSITFARAFKMNIFRAVLLQVEVSLDSPERN